MHSVENKLLDSFFLEMFKKQTIGTHDARDRQPGMTTSFKKLN